MKKHLKCSAGQATIEYILIFAFMSLVGVSLAGTIGSGIKGTVKGLGFVLSQELSTGVCESACFYGKYKNGIFN
ncbi:MAG: hypothetical protein VXV96_01555 [Bdellovibrionota bacterium]|jgi:Flp pilus assembly pilin Flp|nr:hypothetical protein [Bdellovibrionota bacterium]